MSKIKEEMILKSIEEKKDMLHSILLLRLYEEYERIDSPKINTNPISLIKMRASYNNIKEAISNISENNKINLNNELLKCIKTYFILLDNCMNNFKIDDIEKIKIIKDYTTILECYLKLPITFPERLEECIKKELNINNGKKRIKG